jgi:hypothetical protein
MLTFLNHFFQMLKSSQHFLFEMVRSKDHFGGIVTKSCQMYSFKLSNQVQKILVSLQPQNCQNLIFLGQFQNVKKLELLLLIATLSMTPGKLAHSNGLTKIIRSERVSLL